MSDRVLVGARNVSGDEKRGARRACGSEEGSMHQEMEETRAELKRAQKCTVELEQELKHAREEQERTAERLTQEVSQLTAKMKEERDKYSMLWHLNCMQLTEHETIACKETETCTLLVRVDAPEAGRSSGSTPTPVHHDGTGERTTPDHVGHTGRDVDGEAVVSVSDPGCSPTHLLPSVSSGRGVSIPSTPSGPGQGHPVVPLTGGIPTDDGTGHPPVFKPCGFSAPATSTL